MSSGDLKKPVRLNEELASKKLSLQLAKMLDNYMKSEWNVASYQFEADDCA